MCITAFVHNHFGNPSETGNNPHSNNCPHCNTYLQSQDLNNDHWRVEDNRILQAHRKTARDYKEFHGLEDCYLNLIMDTKEEETWIQYCGICGWWRIVKQICISAEQWQIWDIFFGVTGVLKNLDVRNINLPIDEVSRYLIAKYEDRFSVNPRLFEAVVADVFRSLGYHTHVTGYSNDGGIDVILQDVNSGLVGVQVKRYKRKIKVEQIRAFAGALLLAGYPKGVFVTTSSFQPGAKKSAATYRTRNYQIELMDSEKFYDALKISRTPLLDCDTIISNLKTCFNRELYDYEFHTPRNSL